MNRRLMAVLLIFSFIFVFIGAYFKNNTTLAIIFFSLGFIFFAAGMIFEVRLNKETNDQKLADLKNDEEESKELVLKHKDDNNTLGFIYEVYNKKYEELNEILDKCPYEISYDYDEEEKTYMLSISNFVGLGKKNDESFVIAIYSSPEDDVIAIDDENISIKNLTKDEILELLLKELRKHELPKSIDFVIRIPKWTLCLYILSFLAGGVGMAISSVFYAMNKLILDDYLISIVILLFFTIIGVFGIIEYYNNKIELKHDCLTYTNIFGKKKSCMANDIKYINVGHSKNSSIIYFYDHNDKLIMKINVNSLMHTNFVMNLSIMANWYHFSIAY